MTPPMSHDLVSGRLRRGIVLRVEEDACEVVSNGQFSSVSYATLFPSPRVERVSPGHLVAVATAPDGTDLVVWMWYDAVVIGVDAGLTRLWEPAHGEVVARSRRSQQERLTGTPPVRRRAHEGCCRKTRPRECPVTGGYLGRTRPRSACPFQLLGGRRQTAQ